MKIDALTVVLRPRTAWEAVELGTALVRRHAAAIWRPWLAVTLPLFALVNLVAHAIGHLWVAALLMWWLKPLFARIPLFVLSRAVFGDVPRTGAAVRGAFHGGARAMLGYLTWRRLGPARALLMPVDLLEGGTPAQAAQRRRVVAGPAYGTAALTLVVFLHFEAVLALGLGMLAFLFVPEQYMPGALERLWTALRESPAWLGVATNALAWAATSALEPFHVGAGFGLYLNRRTAIEGWDIDLAFRRLRTRLQAVAPALLLAVLLGTGLRAGAAEPGAPSCPAPPADASTPAVSAAPGEGVLPAAFDDHYVPPGRFDDAVARAYRDPRITPRRTVTTWQPRQKNDARPGDMPGWLKAIGAAIATLGELALWIVAGLLLALLAFTARRWWPWLRGLSRPRRATPTPVVHTEAPVEAPLPRDVPAAARRLWAAGQPREALALVYRAVVQSMVETTGRPLVPGATEAQCLRASAALPAGPRAAFAQAVRLWQPMAYADRVPDGAAFEAMLDGVAVQFGWPR